MSNKICDFWKAHDTKILTALAIILVAVVAFRAGQTQERENVAANINVSINSLTAANPAGQKVKTLGETLQRKGISVNEINGESQKQGSADTQNKECTFVGSKNSNKYHFPTCSYAKRIKPENIVCFSGEEDAKNKGYIPAGCCVGKK